MNFLENVLLQIQFFLYLLLVRRIWVKIINTRVNLAAFRNNISKNSLKTFVVTNIYLLFHKKLNTIDFYTTKLNIIFKII